jgi:hypothetical protein
MTRFDVDIHGPAQWIDAGFNGLKRRFIPSDACGFQNIPVAVQKVETEDAQSIRVVE